MSSKKTYLGLSFASIMTKDMVTPKSWVLTGASNAGNMKGFNNQWFGFKKGYRDRHLYKHMIRKMGTKVSGTGTRYDIDSAAEATYLSSTIGDFKSVIGSGISIVDENTLAALHMQSKFGHGWADTYVVLDVSFSKKNQSVIGGINISKFTITYKNPSLDDPNDSTKNPPTVEKDIPNPYPSKNMYIVVYASNSHPHSLVKVLEVSDVSHFATEVALEFVPFIPVQENGRRAPAGSDDEKYVEWFFKRLGIDPEGENGEGLYHELDKIEEKGKTKAIDNAFVMLGIQPNDPYYLPVCGSSVKAQDIQEYSEKILKYVDLDENQLENENYRVSLPCGPETLRGSRDWWAKKNNMRRNKFAKMFYNLIKYYGNGTSTTRFGMMDSSISIKFMSTTHTGTFATRRGKRSKMGQVLLGQWSKKPPPPSDDDNIGGGLGGIIGGINSGPDGEMLMFKQLTETTYERISITQITQKIAMSGEQFSLFIDGSWRSSADKNSSGGAGELFPQLWYPFHLYEKLDFTSVIIAREYGTKFLFFSKQVVKTNWLKIIIGVILIIVMCVYAGCAGAEWVAGNILGMSAAGAAAAGAAGAVTASMVIYAVGITAIGLLVGELISNIDNPWARALAQVVYTVVMAYMMGGMSFESLNAENYLMLATQVTTIVYNAYVEIQMKDLGEKRRAQQALEMIQDKQDRESEGSGLHKADMSSHHSHVETNSPDALYGQMENMYNYDQYWAASEQLDLRVNVVPG